MEIHVIMSEAEMNDFLQYRKEKAGRASNRDRLQDLAKKVLKSITVNEDGLPFVFDDDHAEELLEMAVEYAK